jgi:hypothetical protein
MHSLKSIKLSTENQLLLSGSTSFRIIPAEIIFGTPSKQCMGHGICMMMSPENLTKFKCQRFKTSIIRSCESKIIIWMQIQQIPSNVLERQFSGNRFIVEEKYNLPLIFSKSLGFNHPYSIPVGQYKMTRSKQYITIELPLEKDMSS